MPARTKKVKKTKKVVAARKAKATKLITKKKAKTIVRPKRTKAIKKAVKKIKRTKKSVKPIKKIKLVSKKIKKKVKAKKMKAVKKAKKVVLEKKAHPPKKVKVKTLISTAEMPWLGEIEPYKPKKTEKYMSKKMLEHFRKILIMWKQKLMEEVDSTVQHMQEDAANYPDPSDRATQEEGFSLELRTRDRERKLIKKIEEVLQLIDNEEYGYCESCGEEVGLRRLEARPTATLCIDCKTLDEIREKQQGI